MVSTDSIFIHRYLAISIVCSILIIYPILMLTPWNAFKDLVVWFDNRLKVVLDTETPEAIYISKNIVTEF